VSSIWNKRKTISRYERQGLLSILLDASRALEGLHRTKIAHLLVGEKSVYIQKDAGFLGTFDSHAAFGMSSGAGEENYFPPEVLRAFHQKAKVENFSAVRTQQDPKPQITGLEVTSSRDMWSFGALLYLVETGSRLIDAKAKLKPCVFSNCESKNEVCYFSFLGIMEESLERFKVSEDLVHVLMRQLLDTDPSKRPSARVVTLVLKGYLSNSNSYSTF
jgi:serine/threonine protein kinase